MKDQWLKDIHDRMSDFEVEEPAGLWDAIEGGLDVVQPVSLYRATWHRRLKRISAAAAMLAVVATLCRFILWDEATGVSDPVDYAEIPAVKKHAGDSGVDEVLLDGSRDFAASVEDTFSEAMRLESATLSVENGDDCSLPAVSAKNGEAVPAADTAVVNDNEFVPDRKTPDGFKKKASSRKMLYAGASPGSTRGHGRISVSAFTSGGIGMAMNGRSSMGEAAGVAGAAGAQWNDSPMLGFLLFNKGLDVESEIKHRLPVKTGMTLAYQVNDRLSVETGLIYTNLTSDLKFGGENHYFSGRQTLHYVGVPFNVRYRAFSWRRFEVYASAGVTGEKCVSGKSSKDYMFDNRKVETETDNVEVKPLQWSLNVAAGLQFNVAKAVGVYAEPGVGYYFDNGSPVRTIYKDKPFNFNMNLGLRLTLGR